jgi:two-component system, cell cycle response regulator
MTGRGSDGRHKVLLVDDSALVLRIASAYLSENYDVVTSSSGEEALDKALAEQPDVILMDQHMEGQSGVEAADSLFRDQRTQDIPVVIMTTAAEVALLPAHLDRLTKPFDKRAVLAKVQTCLGKPLTRPVSE